MEYVEKNIPLWQITIWDKKFNDVDKKCQPKTIKYNYLLSDELDALRVDDGNVRILYTGKNIGYTTEELAGSNLSEGEVVSIPWGGIPTVKYYNGKFVTGDNRIATSSDTDRLLNKYLYYYMSANIHKIASFYRGASLKHPCMRDVLNMTISFPSIEKQEEICRQFDTLEKIIYMRKREMTLLEKTVRARFVEMFGGVHDSRLYPYTTVESFTTVKSGGTPEREIQEYWQGGNIRWVKTTELQNCVITDTEEKITQLAMDNSSAKLIPADSVLIAMYGQGKTRGMTGYLATDSTTNQACACILPSGAVNQKYLWKYMILSYDKLRGMAKGGNQPNLNTGIIKRFPILMPPLELQNQFAAFVEQVDKSKVAVQKALDKTQILFDSLMQKYFG
jgi:type I restriction enzyme S subunit